jgi:hypothetical protein
MAKVELLTAEGNGGTVGNTTAWRCVSAKRVFTWASVTFTSR